MKYKYDQETDILTIELSRGKPDFGDKRGNIITHYNKGGKPIEIEILDASRATIDMLSTIMKKRLNLTLSRF